MILCRYEHVFFSNNKWDSWIGDLNFFYSYFEGILKIHFNCHLSWIKFLHII
jgi:hypothetical protein